MWLSSSVHSECDFAAAVRLVTQRLRRQFRKSRLPDLRPMYGDFTLDLVQISYRHSTTYERYRTISRGISYRYRTDTVPISYRYRTDFTELPPQLAQNGWHQRRLGIRHKHLKKYQHPVLRDDVEQLDEKYFINKRGKEFIRGLPRDTARS